MKEWIVYRKSMILFGILKIDHYICNMKTAEYNRRMNRPNGRTTINIVDYMNKHNLIKKKMTFVEWLKELEIKNRTY